MYPTAITQQAIATVAEHREREAEAARHAPGVRPDDGRVTRALITIGKSVPAASLAPWLAGRS
jgi:hypothetical protein